MLQALIFKVEPNLFLNLRTQTELKLRLFKPELFNNFFEPNQTKIF